MKIALVGLLGFSMLSCTSPAKEQWSYIADESKVFVLKPGELKTLDMVYRTMADEDHIRYDLISTLPVNTGLDPGKGGWPIGANCYETQIIKSTKSCVGMPVGEPRWIVVQDIRTTGDVIGGVILRNQDAVANNKVSITTYHWGCVTGCAK